MKEFTKKQLVSIINESHLDVDEMAVKRKHDEKRSEDWQKTPPKFKPMWKETNETDIPDYWIVNVNQIRGEEVLAVPLGCDLLDNFVKENESWLKSIGELHELEPQLIACSRGKYHRPVEKYYAGGYKPTGKKYEIEESLKRKINPILNSQLDESGEDGGSELSTILNSVSMPSIITKDPKYLDSYNDIWTNEKIFFRSKNFHGYESANDFLLSVVDRIYGGEGDTKKAYYQARQFNKKFSNWENTRKQDKRYEGKTDIFQLDKRGYEELNLDVALESIFELSGIKMNDTFKWTISMKLQFGRKRPDEYRIRQGLKTISLKDGGIFDNQPITVSKVVQLDSEKTYDGGNNTIMDDIAVRQGLIEVISDFKSLIESIKNADPEVALSIANYSQSDVETVNETITKNRLQEIINEMAKKK